MVPTLINPAFVLEIATGGQVQYSPPLNELVDILADVEGATLLQGARDHADYEDRALACHYRLSLILRDFNRAELEVLFSTSLPSFYGKLDKDGKRG